MDEDISSWYPYVGDSTKVKKLGLTAKYRENGRWRSLGQQPQGGVISQGGKRL